MSTPKAAKSRRVFAPGKCHQRDANGQPSCRKAIVARGANLCPTHEAVWQKAARERAKERVRQQAIADYEATQKATAKAGA